MSFRELAGSHEPTLDRLALAIAAEFRTVEEKRALGRLDELADELVAGSAPVEEADALARASDWPGPPVLLPLEDTLGDRTVLQVKPPAVAEESDLRRPGHGRDLPTGCCGGNWRISVLSFNDESGRT